MNLSESPQTKFEIPSQIDGKRNIHVSENRPVKETYERDIFYKSLFTYIRLLTALPSPSMLRLPRSLFTHTRYFWRNRRSLWWVSFHIYTTLDGAAFTIDASTEWRHSRSLFTHIRYFWRVRRSLLWVSFAVPVSTNIIYFWRRCLQHQCCVARDLFSDQFFFKIFFQKFL